MSLKVRQTSYQSAHRFVKQSVAFRILAAVVISVFISATTSWTFALTICAACLFGVGLELLSFSVFVDKIEHRYARIAIGASTFLHLSVFAIPIPIAMTDPNLGLTFVAAIYACSGLVYPLIGYRSVPQLVVVSTLPYVLVTAMAAGMLTQFYLGAEAAHTALISVAIVPAFLCIGIVLYTALRQSDTRFYDLVAEANQQRELADEQRERAETALLKTDAASVAKSDFLASMSHEIRTPMNGVVGMAELLLQTELNPAQAQYARVISSSGDRLMVIIDDILDFSKLEAGQVELHPEPFELAALIENVAVLAAEKAREKSLDVMVRIDPNLPEHVVGDPLRLRQILHKLASNAVKFTDHGYVILSVTGAQQPGGEAAIELSVTDSGIGIEPTKIDHMFDRFSQASNGAARIYGGTGIGLAICRELTDLMGGALSGISEPGEGSVFTLKLTLPVASVRAEPMAVLPNRLHVGIFAASDLSAVVFTEMLGGLNLMTTAYAPTGAGVETLMQQIRDGAAPAVILLDTRVQLGAGNGIVDIFDSLPAALRPPVILLCDPDELTTYGENALTVTRPVRIRDLTQAMALALSYRERVIALTHHAPAYPVKQAVAS
jgi:signal transduction histidine kinase